MNSEEWEDVIKDFQPKTEEQKRKEVEAETRRLQLPLPEIKIRDVGSKLYNPKDSSSTN